MIRRVNALVHLCAVAYDPFIWPVPRGINHDEPSDYAYLERRHLIDLPTVWERDTVAALLDGATLDVPHGRSGAFIDTRKPCVWGAIRHTNGVVGLVALRDRGNRW